MGGECAEGAAAPPVGKGGNHSTVPDTIIIIIINKHVKTL